MLAAFEKRKGEPLTEEEVLSIRDESTVLVMEVSRANELAESRGYTDIDPERYWEEWQELRQSRLHE
jgi:hypothetical protein